VVKRFSNGLRNKRMKSGTTDFIEEKKPRITGRRRRGTTDCKEYTNY